ncbi:tetratricopeptide repeat protein [Massilia sp. CCM 9210]|uniref:tetratricopeptide repeat protein n=1 Tax=Massilia scottii TaxID=3057166 RepID=UPI002796A7CE|nr:tetratricopeptide repeat protein [Massilia sp. CCM 9210]MDQ1817128.1 tetratricopeptide repeat protein [Massilia sp. CCM 9210]
MNILMAAAGLLVSAAIQAAPGKACDVDTGKTYQASQDHARAVACYEIGVANGIGEAFLLLGSMRLDGLGVPQDTAKAKELFLQAAAKGVAPAMYNLGVMHERGVLGAPDMPAAAKYYRQAADLGMAEAQGNLGLMYLNGNLVPSNYEEAERLLTLAAADGQVQAQFNLGVLYINGFKKATHLGQAAVWLERAALRGHPVAPKILGDMYAGGHGVTADRKQAATWFFIADRAGNPEATKSLGKLPGGLSEAEREAARKGMREFLDKQQVVIAREASSSPNDTTPIRSRCAVAVITMAPPESSGDGAVQFKRLMALTNQNTSGFLIDQLRDYRLLVLKIDAADALRAGESMTTAMRENDCSQAIELTHEYGKVAGGGGGGGGGFVQYTLNVYKRPANGAPRGDIVHTKVYRTNMADAFESLDFRTLAGVFVEDLKASRILVEAAR